METMYDLCTANHFALASLVGGRQGYWRRQGKSQKEARELAATEVAAMCKPTTKRGELESFLAKERNKKHMAKVAITPAQPPIPGIETAGGDSFCARYRDWFRTHKHVCEDDVLVHFLGCSDNLPRGARYGMKTKGWAFTQTKDGGWDATPPPPPPPPAPARTFTAEQVAAAIAKAIKELTA